jgi:hypothetical protein
MLRDHNERFFYLTSQNLKIVNDTWVGMVQFRLGQSDSWVYMGMTTVICDAAAKVRKAPNGGFGMSMADGVVNTAKKPSAGLDLGREVLDMRRTSYRCVRDCHTHTHTHILCYSQTFTFCRFYLKGWVQQDDSQKIVQLRRTSEAGLQTGYVLFVGGEIERMPENELAQDCVLPEGPPDKFEIMNALLNSIPRDANYDSELWTTVDKERTNVRVKAVSKIIQGFSLYLVLMGKNFIFEHRTETRYMLVCLVTYPGQLNFQPLPEQVWNSSTWQHSHVSFLMAETIGPNLPMVLVHQSNCGSIGLLGA